MAAEKEKFTFKGFIERILEPSQNIKGAGARQQAHITTLISLILGATCLFAAIIFIIVGMASGLIVSMFILAGVMATAFALGRSDNYQAGSIVMVSGIILSGFLIAAAVHDNLTNVLILLSTIVPALTLGILLLPFMATIIITIVTIIGIGSMPLIASVNVTSGLILFISLIIIEGVFILTTHLRDQTDTQQLEEIGSLRGRLEERVEERTRFTRIAAEIAQEIISATSLDEVMTQTVNLVNSRFNFLYTGIYLTDDAEKLLTLRAAQGQDSERIVREGKRISFGPPNMLGWVAENKQQHVVTRSVEDSLQLQADLLPEAQSEISLPIMSSERILGVLDVQSARTTTFDNETIVVLQMLANQIATGIKNVRQFEFEQGSVQEVVQVYLTGHKAAKSKTEAEVYQAVQELFSKSTYLAMLLTERNKELWTNARANIVMANGETLPDSIPVALEELAPILGMDVFIGEGNRLNALPYNMVRFIRQFQIFSMAILPLKVDETVSGVLLLGTQEKAPLELANLQPYINLSSQISTSLTNIQDAQKLEERVKGMETIARLSMDLTEAKAENRVLEAIQHLFQGEMDSVVMLQAEQNQFRLITNPNFNVEGERVVLPEMNEAAPAEVARQIGNKILMEEVSKLTALSYAQFHPELQKFLEGEPTALPVLNNHLVKLIEMAGFKRVAFIPVFRDEELIYLLVHGTHGETTPLSSLGFYQDVRSSITEAYNRIRNENEIEHRLSQDETIIQMGQEITSIRDLSTVYQTLHTHIRQTIGNVNFLVSIFDSQTNSISIPYMFEKSADGNDTIGKLEPFPLGEGLISIPIRTKQPLLLVEDTEKRAAALGAKVIGKSAKSWLGTPMIISDEVVGVIVVQDPEREFAFKDNDVRFLTSLSGQIAGTIYNNRLLNETRNRAVQLQTAAEIARDISGLLDLDELLNKAITLIRERFNFYHAAVFLVDPVNEFAHIREATGEAGLQMKRAGHKLKVGSKSIVGFVTGSGEPLIVNDTTRDATYFANPLLPETRAEVAVPMKVGQRILGALDVQSTQAYSFVEEDISVLRILADQMAIAVMNSELFADTQEHLSQSRLLHHVTTAAASGTTLEEALSEAAKGLQVTLGGDRVSILMADKDHKTLTIKSYVGYSEEVANLIVPFGEGITGWVAVHQQPQRVNDVSQDLRYIQAGSNVHSELAVPLLYRGDLLGVLNVESDQTGAYNENDEEMLGTLGGSLAAIIANARLIEQVRHQVDRERLLYEVTSKIRRSTDMQTIMASTATELSKALGARQTKIKIGTTGNDPKPNRPAAEKLPQEGELQ